MIKRVLVIGGYGNFGSFISKALAQDENIQVIIAGRSRDKANQLASKLGAEAFVLDINNNLEQALSSIKPDIVIHTSGPFQNQGYNVANACIEVGAHYIDLADGRTFVAGINQIHEQAKAKDVLVISGASSVPCLTSALLDHYQEQFEHIDTLEYGITTAQKTARGLATTAAILGYTGKPFKTLIDGEICDVYGWQDLHIRKYKGLGTRFLGNCDVPDLALFPDRYPDLKTIRFYAGLELSFVHVTLWLFSWLVRLKLIRNLEKLAPLMLRLSYLFDVFGTDKSAFHMALSGAGKAGEEKTLTFELTARSGHGPYIPCMPAILLARKLAREDITQTGAYACMGFITKDEYLDALNQFDIHWNETV